MTRRLLLLHTKHQRVHLHHVGSAGPAAAGGIPHCSARSHTHPAPKIMSGAAPASTEWRAVPLLPQQPVLSLPVLSPSLSSTCTRRPGLAITRAKVGHGWLRQSMRPFSPPLPIVWHARCGLRHSKVARVVPLAQHGCSTLSLISLAALCTLLVSNLSIEGGFAWTIDVFFSQRKQTFVERIEGEGL